MKLIATKPIIEYRAMPKSIETRNSLISEMQSLVDKAKIERRGMSETESNRFEAIKKEIEKLDTEIAKQDQLETRQFTYTTGKELEEIRSFVRFCQSGEIRDLSTSGSGVVIPKTVADMVVRRVKELAPIYERMTHFNVTGDLAIPTYDYSAHTTAFLTQFATITATGGSFLSVDLKAYPIGTLAKISKSLINRTDLDVISIIVEMMAQSIADFLNDQIINNTGGQFSGTLQAVTQNLTGAGITGDSLIALQMTVPSQFQPNSAWLMHPTTYTAVRQLKTADGSYLMPTQGGISGDFGFNLLGKPVMLDEHVAPMGVGARAIYYGDFGQLYCNTNAPLNAQVLLERYADQYAVGIVTTQELDINLATNQALAVYIGA